MKTKTKELTKQIIEAMLDSSKITHIDSSDREPVEISTDKYTFETVQWLDDRESNKPLGKFIYTITVKGSYIPFEDK